MDVLTTHSVFLVVLGFALLALVYLQGRSHGATSTTTVVTPPKVAPVSRPLVTETEVVAATAALDTAGIKGTEKLNTIAAVRRGDVRVDEVVNAHKKD